MKLHSSSYRKPSPRLSGFVGLLWQYERYASPHGKERALPGATTELVIDLDGGATVVSGAQSRYFVLDLTQPRTLLGVHFKPGGAFPFLGVPAGELANQVLSLEALWGPAADDLRDRLLEARAAEERFALMEAALLARVTNPPERHPAVAFALRAFRPGPEARSVGEVTETLALTPRRFIQRFRDEVGLTPKLFARVRRFQAALRRIHAGSRIEWTGFALDCGYYDQAHFIHEFRAFSGLSPRAYLAQRGRSANHIPHTG